MFGLFARKSTTDDTSSSQEIRTNNARLPTPTPSIASVTHHSPLRFSTTIRAVLGGSTTDSTLKDTDLATDSVTEGGNHAMPPPETPSPPLVGSNETKALYDLVLTIPPKILHAYTLAHLRPQPPLPLAPTTSPAPGLHPEDTPRPPSPNTVAKLTTFFSTLAPPPLLHCVRCHKDFFDVENEEKDKACRVPHDDESTLVSRASGGGYETLWGCCGQTVSGDGSEGPPDGWCYEGRHTTDVKRARFRADSTIHADKLTSCLKLNCHGIRDRLLVKERDSHASPSHNNGMSSARKSNPSPVRSQASRSTRKRPRESLKEVSSSQNEADADGAAGRVVKAKNKEKVNGGAGEGDEDTSMAVDEPNPTSKPKEKTKSRPISLARPPVSTSTTASGTNITRVVSSKPRTTSAKPKSTSRMILSQSHTHLPSDSETSTRSRPRTRSHVREESRTRPTSKLTKASISERMQWGNKATKPPSPSSTSEEELETETDLCQESDQEARWAHPRTRSHVREESRVRDAAHTLPTSKLTKASISERTKRGKKATKPRSPSPTSDEEPEAQTDVYQESDQEARGRDRKKRRLRRD